MVRIGCFWIITLASLRNRRRLTEARARGKRLKTSGLKKKLVDITFRCFVANFAFVVETRTPKQTSRSFCDHRDPTLIVRIFDVPVCLLSFFFFTFTGQVKQSQRNKSEGKLRIAESNRNPNSARNTFRHSRAAIGFSR
jgi:hypothetical protein